MKVQNLTFEGSGAFGARDAKIQEVINSGLFGGDIRTQERLLALEERLRQRGLSVDGDTRTRSQILRDERQEREQEERIERIFERVGGRFFAALGDEIFKRVSDKEISNLFGFATPDKMGRKRLDAFKDVAKAVSAVHIKNSLQSDDIFSPVLDEIDKFFNNFDRRINYKENKPGKLAKAVVKSYLKACDGLFLHDIMHAVTKGHFVGDLAASFLEPTIRQDNNPELIKEEFPTLLFNVGEQILPIAAMLDPEKAKLKVKELRNIRNRRKNPNGTKASGGQVATADDRLGIYERIAKNGKPTFEEFVDLFFEDAFHFLKNAQLDATERRFLKRNPKAIGQDAQGFGAARALRKYASLFAQLRAEADPILLDYLRQIYDSQNIPETLFDIVTRMDPFLDAQRNGRRKGFIGFRDKR